MVVPGLEEWLTSTPGCGNGSACHEASVVMSVSVPSELVREETRVEWHQQALVIRLGAFAVIVPVEASQWLLKILGHCAVDVAWKGLDSACTPAISRSSRVRLCAVGAGSIARGRCTPHGRVLVVLLKRNGGVKFELSMGED